MKKQCNTCQWWATVWGGPERRVMQYGKKIACGRCHHPIHAGDYGPKWKSGDWRKSDETCKGWAEHEIAAMRRRKEREDMVEALRHYETVRGGVMIERRRKPLLPCANTNLQSDKEVDTWNLFVDRKCAIPDRRIHGEPMPPNPGRMRMP